MSRTRKNRYKQRRDQEILCPEEGCGRTFRTPAGLQGHLRWTHGLTNTEAKGKPLLEPKPKEPIDNSQELIENLKRENQQLKLEQTNRRLRADFPEASPKHLPDIMEQAGVGSIDGEAKEIAQKRILGIQTQAPSWLDRLLSNPQGIQTAVNGIKGILGVDKDQHPRNGDDSLSLLKSLGLDLPKLIQASLAPKGNSNLEIGGLNLSGVSLTPDVFSSIIAYKTATEVAQKNFEGRKVMADSLETVLKAVGQGLAERLSNTDGAAGISRPFLGVHDQAPPAQKFAAICPSCGFENILPSDLASGAEIHCQGPDCKETWVAVDPSLEEPMPEAESIAAQQSTNENERSFEFENDE